MITAQEARDRGSVLGKILEENLDYISADINKAIKHGKTNMAIYLELMPTELDVVSTHLEDVFGYKTSRRQSKHGDTLIVSWGE